MVFKQQLKKEIQNKKSNICVGLDSDYEKIPEVIRKKSSIKDAIFNFNKEIIDATNKIVPAYKLNIVCYSGYGLDGIAAMLKTNEYIRQIAPSVKIIADSKRSEMKRTAELAAKELFDEFLFDATTITPWFGFDTVEPFLQYKDKAIFMLCHDSNPSAGDIQDLELSNGEKVYKYVTKLVNNSWNKNENILIEGPLTYPNILKELVELSPENQFFLAAGLGAQGGKIEDLILFKDKNSFLVNASRSIIFSSNTSNFAEKALEVTVDYSKTIRKLFE